MGPKSDSRSDEELIAACNEGSAEAATEAFGSLYQRHRDYVLRIALRLTPDREIAADVLQEVFGYLLRQFPPPGPGLTLTARFSTYLYPIARNTTLNLLRKARREARADIEPDELASPGRPDQETGDLDRLLASLSPQRQEILMLRFVDGMSLEEVAAVLEIPLGTVKSRLHNAIRALREDPAAKKFFEA
jgi:RNA polymerase sigma-70 factor (ECF subfamily)